MNRVQIVQINLHQSKAASATLAKLLAGMQTVIALIQKPWIFNNAIKGLTGCGKFSGGDLTAAQVRLNLEQGRGMDIIVGLAYMPHDSTEPHPPDEVRELCNHVKRRRLQLLLGFDANSHHAAWESTGCNGRGESFQEFIMRAGLHILNRGTEPTFVDRRRQKVLDITLVTDDVASLVGDWRVSKDLSAPDHRTIRIFVLFEEPIDLALRLRPISLRFGSKKQLEEASKLLHRVIIDSYEENCKLLPRRRKTEIPSWSEDELGGLRNETRKAFNKAKNARKGPRKEAAWTTYRGLLAKYNKAIKAAKDRCWRASTSGIESQSETARLEKILGINKTTYLGSLQAPDGSNTETIEETLKLLMETHFPGFTES
ncbi:uncharacterized protein LOC107043689 [Diachasma alloeum]|uniref:uncharacterized protein LOC107043689 n=1 Tax=Diachasma alloeum TaxID=454923 RepID=UPI0007382243|nr:uncharacterized protein LOC107043689 [Diachasma alloeum]